MDGPAATHPDKVFLMETDMNTLNQKIVFCIGLMMLFGQQTAFADYRSHSHRDTRINYWRAEPAPYNSRFNYRLDRHRRALPPSYRPYYKPGYRVNPMPYGHTRRFVNNAEYFNRHPRSYIVAPVPGFGYRR